MANEQIKAISTALSISEIKKGHKSGVHALVSSSRESHSHGENLVTVTSTRSLAIADDINEDELVAQVITQTLE